MESPSQSYGKRVTIYASLLTTAPLNAETSVSTFFESRNGHLVVFIPVNYRCTYVSMSIRLWRVVVSEPS